MSEAQRVDFIRDIRVAVYSVATRNPQITPSGCLVSFGGFLGWPTDDDMRAALRQIARTLSYLRQFMLRESAVSECGTFYWIGVDARFSVPTIVTGFGGMADTNLNDQLDVFMLTLSFARDGSHPPDAPGRWGARLRKARAMFPPNASESPP